MDKPRLLGFWRQIQDLLDELRSIDMSISDLLELLQKLLGVLRLPEWENAAAVREWVLDVIELLNVAADITATDIDDEVVDWLQGIVTSDEKWFTVYGLVIDLLDGDADQDRIAATADQVDLDPTIIIMIIEIAIRVMNWWRNR